MTSPTTDFGQRELIPGTLTGVRRFNVDALGRLTGVTHKDVWRPGVNEGTCKGNSGLTTWPSGYHQYSSSGGYITYHTSPNINIVEPEAPEPPSHRVGSKYCTCGYYAFFDYDAENHGYQKGHVTAIVEGTGVATVGEKGFRCEKAEVVALVKSSPEPKPEAAKPEPEPQWRKRDWMPGAAAATFCAVAAVLHAVAGNWLVMAVMLALVGINAMFVRSSRPPRGRNRSKALPSSLAEIQAELNKLVSTTTQQPVDWDLVRRNYPDVPVYDTLDAALSEHPLSQRPPKPVIAPDTVDDFWTRRADA